MMTRRQRWFRRLPGLCPRWHSLVLAASALLVLLATPGCPDGPCGPHLRSVGGVTGPSEACVGTYYRADLGGWFDLSGLTPALCFELVRGDLASIGLSLDADGLLSGTPTATNEEGLQFEVQVISECDEPETGPGPRETFTLYVRDMAISDISSSEGVCSGEQLTWRLGVCGGESNYRWHARWLTEGLTLAPPAFDSGVTSEPEASMYVDLPEVSEVTYLSLEVSVDTHVDSADHPGGIPGPIRQFDEIPVGPTHEAWPSALPAVTTRPLLPYAFLGEDYPPLFLQACPPPPTPEGESSCGYYWTVSSGSLPDGLNLPPSGELSGRVDDPGMVGLHLFEAAFVCAADAEDLDFSEENLLASALFSLRVLGSGDQLECGGGLPEFTECYGIGSAFNMASLCTGGFGDIHWQDADGGELFPGVRLAWDGSFDGRPNAPFEEEVTIEAYDGAIRFGDDPHAFGVSISVTPLAENDPELDILQMRQWAEDDAEHPVNELVLNLPPGEETRRLKVDFEIDDPLDGEWRGLDDTQKRVKLTRIGNCGLEVHSESTTTRDVDGDGVTEHIAHFTQEDLLSLVSVPDQDYVFRVFLEKAEEDQPGDWEWVDFLVHQTEEINVESGE